MILQMITFATHQPPLDALRSGSTSKHENDSQTCAYWDPPNGIGIRKNTNKCGEKVNFETDTKKVAIWGPPDLQAYGFRAREFQF